MSDGGDGEIHDEQCSATLAFAKQLISCRSLTPDDDGCQTIIRERLEAIGFNCTPLNFGEVTNLWARRGDAKPLFCFAGHTDVVPTGPLDKWHTDPFQPVVQDGMLYGRGSADMKTGIAAFVTAVEAFVMRYPDHSGSIALLITSDEEGPAVDGTVRVVEWLKSRGERIDYTLVGEPSSTKSFGDVVRNGRRGSLSAHLTVKGIQGHIAYPHLARNPILEVAPAIAELGATVWDGGNAHFPPTTFQVSNIHGGTGAFNVIPGVVEVYFNFRFATASTAADLQARTEAILHKHGLTFDIKWTLGGKPFLTERGALVNALSRAIESVTHRVPELSTGGGTSDGRFIADICNEVAEFGPINASIHQLNEHVALTDIAQLHEVYLRTMENLLIKRTYDQG
jgi:succinyl-diaminopimelate desuccinylase